MSTIEHCIQGIHHCMSTIRNYIQGIPHCIYTIRHCNTGMQHCRSTIPLNRIETKGHYNKTAQRNKLI